MFTVLRSTQVDFDPRPLAIIEGLATLNHRVDVLCWGRELKSEFPIQNKNVNFAVFRMRHDYGSGLKGLHKYLQWWTWLYRELVKRPKNRVIAIDLDTGIIALIAKRIKGIDYSYDQTDPMSARFLNPILKKICNYLEKIVIINANSVTYPTSSRDSGVNKNSKIIQNQFISSQLLHSCKFLPVIKGQLFYGGLLIPGRGLESLITMNTATLVDFSLCIAGYGPLEDDIKRAVEKNPKIRFLGKLQHDELIREAAKSEAILAFYNPEEENNVSNASGKIIEGILLGKPIISNYGINLSSNNIFRVNFERIQEELPEILKSLKDFQPCITDLSTFSTPEAFADFYSKETK